MLRKEKQNKTKPRTRNCGTTGSPMLGVAGVALVSASPWVTQGHWVTDTAVWAVHQVFLGLLLCAGQLPLFMQLFL